MSHPPAPQPQPASRPQPSGQPQRANQRQPANQPQPAGQLQPASQPQPEPYVFDLDGGRPCLDFCNTRGSSPPASDHLNSYADLVAFAAQSDLIAPADAEWLRAEGERDPATAAGVMTRARRLREAMHSLFSALAAGRKLSSSELSVLNVDLATSLSHARVVPNGSAGFRWGWSGRNLDAPIWPITRSAADLLTSDEERALVRECGADDCVWLFVDTTRNRSRQWCSMQSCGNREKARRHYQRVRQGRAVPALQSEASAQRVPDSKRGKSR